jgi:hypothetical protein
MPRLHTALNAGVLAWVTGSHSISESTTVQASAVLILVLTPAAMASSNVEDEWQYALDKGQPVITVPRATVSLPDRRGRRVETAR